MGNENVTKIPAVGKPRRTKCRVKLKQTEKIFKGYYKKHYPGTTYLYMEFMPRVNNVTVKLYKTFDMGQKGFNSNSRSGFRSIFSPECGRENIEPICFFMVGGELEELF